jgi:hypothetical protein
VRLPDPPQDLPEAPRAFYEALRVVLDREAPEAVDWAAAELDFGDGGVAITLPHLTEPDWTLAAQVSRAAAVVFAGPLTEHFGPEDTDAAVGLLARALRGDLEVAVTYRGGHVVRVGGKAVWGIATLARWRPERVETVRPDFHSR